MLEIKLCHGISDIVRQDIFRKWSVRSRLFLLESPHFLFLLMFADNRTRSRMILLLFCLAAYLLLRF